MQIKITTEEPCLDVMPLLSDAVKREYLIKKRVGISRGGTVYYYTLTLVPRSACNEVNTEGEDNGLPI